MQQLNMMVLMFFFTVFCFELIGCKKNAHRRNENHLKVTEGTESRDPASVLLVIKDSICSATVISEDLLLTAGHCADSDKTEDYIVSQNFPLGGDGTVYAGVKQIFLHPKYIVGSKVSEALYDLAVLRSDRPLQAKPRSILIDPVLPGDTIQYLGFGRTIPAQSSSNEDAKQYSGSVQLPLKLELNVDDKGVVKYSDATGKSDYAQNQYVYWMIHSKGLGIGELRTWGQNGVRGSEVFKGSSILPGDSGGGALWGDKIAAVHSSVSVLPDYISSTSVLLSHLNAQVFFCAAGDKGFKANWASRSGEAKILQCDSNLKDRLYPWFGLGKKWQISVVPSGDGSHSEYHCSTNSNNTWDIVDSDDLPNLVSSPSTDFWQNMPSSIKKLDQEKSWIWILDSECKKTKPLADCLNYFNLKTLKGELYDKDKPKEAYFLCSASAKKVEG